MKKLFFLLSVNILVLIGGCATELNTEEQAFVGTWIEQTNVSQTDSFWYTKYVFSSSRTVEAFAMRTNSNYWFKYEFKADKTAKTLEFIYYGLSKYLFKYSFPSNNTLVLTCTTNDGFGDLNIPHTYYKK